MTNRFSLSPPSSSGLALRFLAPVALATLLLGGASASAQGLLDDVQLKRYGLQREWFTQIAVDPARGQLRSIDQHVSSTQARVIYEVKSDIGRFGFSETDLDRFGTPMGAERAKSRADDKVLQLKRMGFEAEVVERTVPRITLFAVTDRAVLHVIDGESGLTRWSRRIGNPNHPTLEAGGNDDYVATVNGTFLSLWDLETGDLVWERQTKGVPGAGPALSDDFVFVPMIDGAMESYMLKDAKEPVHIYKSTGKALIQPITTPRSVVWPTDRGHFYVAPANRRGIRYRLEAHRTISAQAAFMPPTRLCMASTDGYLYALHELSGSPVWNFSTGEPLSRTPLVAHDRVFVVTDDHNLFCISSEDGLLQWVTPRVTRIISISDDRIYCIGTTNRMEILNLDGGGRLASLPMGGIDFRFVNGETDRMFVGTRTGLIQCVRETELPYPLVHLNVAEEKQKKPEVVQEGIDAQPQPDPMPKAPAGGGNNPFDAGKPPAGGGNPFAPGGGNAPPAGGGGNPFAPGGGNAPPAGGGGNPFAPGGGNAPPAGGNPPPAGGGANPFAPGGPGGGANPFAPGQ